MNGHQVVKTVRFLTLLLLHICALVYQKSNYLTIFLRYKGQVCFIDLILFSHISVAKANEFVSILQVFAPFASCDQ